MQASARVSVRARPNAPRAVARAPLRVRAAAVAGEVPDMAKRNTMNLILLGGIGLPVAGLAGPFGEQTMGNWSCTALDEDGTERIEHP